MNLNLASNTIRTRIAIGEGAFIIGLIVVALIGVSALQTVRDTVTRETNTLAGISSASNELLLALFEEMQAAEEYLTNRSTEAAQSFLEADETSHEIQQQLMVLPATGLAGRVALRRIAALQTEAEALYNLAHAQLDIGRRSDALATAALARARTGTLIRLVRSFYQDQEARSTNTSRNLKDAARQREFLLWTVLAASLFVGISIGIATLRYVERPLTRLAIAARRFEAGDLRPVSLGNIPTELADLRSAMGNLGTLLRTVVGEVIGESERIAATTRDIVDIEKQVSTSTEDISGAVERIAATRDARVPDLEAGITRAEELQRGIEDAERTTQQLAELGSDLRELAQTYRTDMEATHSSLATVGELVEKTGGQIEELEELSEPIYRFVDLIKQISSQTNLLAVNAAIEAARAGEKGIGFAVVADEVRQLADSSAQAAEQVSGAIKRVRYQVAEVVRTMELGRSKVRGVGSKADNSSRLLEEIIGTVQRIERHCTQVASAAKENVESVNKIEKALSCALDTSNDQAESTAIVAAALHRQRLSTEDMATRNAVLHHAAEHLRSLVQSFRT
ncbi:MAG: methyl-accepting chemotaxis protein [Gemmatimonadales bacterium]